MKHKFPQYYQIWYHGHNDAGRMIFQLWYSSHMIPHQPLYHSSTYDITGICCYIVYLSCQPHCLVSLSAAESLQNELLIVNGNWSLLWSCASCLWNKKASAALWFNNCFLMLQLLKDRHPRLSHKSAAVMACTVEFELVIDSRKHFVLPEHTAWYHDISFNDVHVHIWYQILKSYCISWSFFYLW